MRIIKELIPYVFIIVIVVLIRTFIVTPVIVSGSSMDPTLNNGNILILNKLAKTYNRDDIVVIDVKVKGKRERIVKRIIGLPGETVKYDNNILYINGKRTHDDFRMKTRDYDLSKYTEYDKIPEGYYFVLGDNRTNSMDSRDYKIGLVKKSQILGKPIFRIWPFNKIGTI